MSQSRSAFRALAKIGRTHHRHRPGRDVFFPPFGRISVFYLLGSNLLLRPVELGPVDPHAMQNDCELARDRDLGLERANRAGWSIVDAMPSRRVVDAVTRVVQVLPTSRSGHSPRHRRGKPGFGTAAADRSSAFGTVELRSVGIAPGTPGKSDDLSPWLGNGRGFRGPQLGLHGQLIDLASHLRADLSRKAVVEAGINARHGDRVAPGAVGLVIVTAGIELPNTTGRAAD